MKTVAVMQPYFMPYAGYFRLMSVADVFVVLDSVQFPRRGWVHRNKLTNFQGQLDWFSLPIQKCPQSTLIQDLSWAEQADAVIRQLIQRFPVLKHNETNTWVKQITTLDQSPTAYLVRLLKAVCATLNLTCEFSMASQLPCDSNLNAQARIIELVKSVGGTHYINLSGGRELYDETGFQQQQIKLDFLPDYQGTTMSMLERLLTEASDSIQAEIVANC